MGTELFDRYVREVGQRLPKRQRADVQAELHSLLLDALQDRLAERGQEGGATEEDQVAILQKLGPPAKVAAGYAPPHRYIIGPRFFVIYCLVAAVVAGSMTLTHLLVLLLALWGGSDSFSQAAATVGEVFGSYLGAILSGMGAVTLTFAILERVFPESAYVARTVTTSPFEEEEPEAWDPRTLPEIEDRDRVEVGSLVAGIVFTVIALIVFNLFPEWVGLTFVGSINDAPIAFHTRPMLAPIFFESYLLWINVLWVAQIGLGLVLLYRGRWQRVTRAIDFLLAVLSAFILYQMVAGPPLLTMEAIRSESLRDTLGSVLHPLVKVGLIVGLISTIVEAVRRLSRVFRIQPASLYQQITAKEPANNH